MAMFTEKGQGPLDSEAGLSIIGTGMRVVGDITADGVVKIEGTVVGTVRAGRQVLVGKGGEVEGDVISREAIIGGGGRGSIPADERVEIPTSCVVDGGNAAQRLLLPEGGEIKRGGRVGGNAPHALNGLQVAKAGDVARVAAAVDLCQATVRMAAEQGADLLLVHHGLFWGGLRPLTGPAYRRVAGLMQKNIALYGVHVPLDLHPDVGNNAVLARQLGVTVRGGFGEEYGVQIGVWGELDAPRGALQQQLAAALGAPPRLMPFGPERVRRVGIVTGGAGSMIGQARAAGLDTYITGEGAHHTFFDAEELGVNVFYAGHYATETVGVKALAEHLCVKFGLPWTFLDHPTGL